MGKLLKVKQNPSVGEKIVFSSLVLVLMAFFMKGAGYLEKRLLGHWFGAGDHLDIYMTALKIGMMGHFMLRGILRSVITPLLTTLKNRSLTEARAFGISLVLTIGILLGVLTFAASAGALYLVKFTAPGFPSPKQLECVQLTRWLLPAGLIMSFANLLGLSLQVRKRFAAAATGEFLQKVIFLFGIVLLAAPGGFFWLAPAQLLSVFLFFVFYSLYHLRYLRRFGHFAYAGGEMRLMVGLAWPVVMGSLVSQLGRLVQTRLASGLAPGSVAALTFAQTTIDLPLNMLPLSLSVVLLPYFSEFSDRKELERSERYLACATRFLLLIFAPIGIYLYFFRFPLLRLMFHGGQFNQESLGLTAQSLAGMSPGLPFFAIEMVLMNYFYAARRMVAPMVCGLVATGAALMVLPWLAERYGLVGISAYLTISRMIKIAILTLCLPSARRFVLLRRSLPFLGKLACALAVLVGFYLFCIQAVFAVTKMRLVPLAALSSLFFIVYLILLFILGFEERRWVSQMLHRCWAETFSGSISPAMSLYASVTAPVSHTSQEAEHALQAE